MPFAYGVTAPPGDGAGAGLSLFNFAGLALRFQPSPHITTVPLRPSERASRLGDVAGSGLSAGPRIESLEEAMRLIGEPGGCVAMRADGDLIDVCSIAPGFICVPMVLAGYVLGVQVYKHLDIFEYVGILAVWAHSQAGLAAFGGCCFRSAKIATIFFYLLLIGSALAVTIIDQLAFLDDWPAPLLLFPLFSYERSLALMLMGDQAPEGELHKAVLYNLGMGTLLFLLGVILHLIIPNEFGLTESQVLVDLCCRKRKRSGPAARPSSSSSRSLEAPLLPEANDDDNDDAVNDQNLMSEIVGDDVDADGVTVDDVAAERHQVLTEPVEDSAGVFKGLQLRYSLGLVEETIRCLGQSLMGWMSSGEQEEESAADGSAYAIRDLTFRIAPAEFFGLLGPSAFRIPPVYHSIGTL